MKKGLYSHLMTCERSSTIRHIPVFFTTYFIVSGSWIFFGWNTQVERPTDRSDVGEFNRSTVFFFFFDWLLRHHIANGRFWLMQRMLCSAEGSPKVPKFCRLTGSKAIGFNEDLAAGTGPWATGRMEETETSAQTYWFIRCDFWLGNNWCSLNFLKNCRLRGVNLNLKDPETFTKYWSKSLVSTTAPLWSHLVGLLPVWFWMKTLSPTCSDSQGLACC